MNRLISPIIVTGLVLELAWPAKAAAAAVPFSGFYVGVNLGAAWGESQFRAINDVPVYPAFIGPGGPVFESNGTVASARGNDTRLIGGGLFGYDWRTSGGVLFGAEADFDGTGLGQHTVATATANGGPTNIHNIYQSVHVDYFARLRWTSSIRGRIGFVRDRLLIYGTGGVVFGQARVDSTLLVSNSFTGATSSQTTRDTGVHTGWTLGAGMAWAFSPAWSAGVEYRYNDFGTRNYNAGPGFSDALPAPLITARMNLTMNQVMVRLNYHIGGL